MNKLQSSITDRMQFTIENGSTTDKIAVAVATGNIDTEGFELDGNGTPASSRQATPPTSSSTTPSSPSAKATPPTPSP